MSKNLNVSNPETGSSKQNNDTEDLNTDNPQHYMKKCLETGMKLFNKETYYKLKGVKSIEEESQEQRKKNKGKQKENIVSSDKKTIFDSSKDKNRIIYRKAERSNSIEREKQKDNHEFRMKKLELELGLESKKIDIISLIIYLLFFLSIIYILILYKVLLSLIVIVLLIFLIYKNKNNDLIWYIFF